MPKIINAKALSLEGGQIEGVTFDTDAYPIAIDSGSTYCLTDNKGDFEGELTRVNVKIQGITDAKGTSKWKGTVVWNIDDDNGKTHALWTPNTLLIEAKLPFRILSPQHLSQVHQANKTDTIKNGTRAIVGTDEVELQWQNQTYTVDRQ